MRTALIGRCQGDKDNYSKKNVRQAAKADKRCSMACSHARRRQPVAVGDGQGCEFLGLVYRKSRILTGAWADNREGATGPACRVEFGVIVLRLAKIALVAAIAFFASLVAFGNITDYGSNFEFVNHVLDMDTIFPTSTIRYRALTSPWIHTLAYCLIIGAELLTALLCWAGVYALLTKLAAKASSFNRAKTWAIGGLTFGFLTWQVGFMSVGGEWFGMWMSTDWNGIESAFRFSTTIIAVLIFVALPDKEPEEAVR